MTPPRVSVLLPVRDAAATLGRALDSLRAQSLADWECLAVDDGSSDASPDLLADAARTDPRFRVLRSPGRGIVDALRHALAAARAPLLARFDADDTCHPDRLAAQLERLAAEPHLGLVSCLVGFDGDRSAAAGYAAHVDWLNAQVTEPEILNARFVESPLAHPSVVFRRQVLETHGTYRDGPFPEDYELWLRWLEAGVRMAKVPAVLLQWNDPPGRLSRTDPRYAPEAFFRLKAAFLARWWLGPSGPARDGRALWIWGSGRVTRRRVDLLLAHGVCVDRYIDIDPHKLGTHRDGRIVVGPDSLPPPGPVFVLGYVANRGAREIQRAHLQRLGYREGTDFLFAA